MAFLDKLKFWKKGDDAFADLDKQLGTIPSTTPGTLEPQGYGPLSHEQGFSPPAEDDLLRSSETGLDFGKQNTHTEGFSGFGLEHPADKQMPSYEQPRQVYEVAPQAAAPQNVSAQLELVAAKLDTIRVSLESINHRLVAVERALHVQDYEEAPVPRKRRGVW